MAEAQEQEMTEEEIARARGDYLEDETPETEDKAESKSEGEAADADADAAADTDADDSAEQPAEPEAAAEELQSESVDSEREDIQKPIMLPKSRFDAAMARAREAEARLAEYEANNKAEPQQAVEPEASAEEDFNAKFDELDEKIASAMDDGDSKAVVQLMKEQRALQNDYMEEQIRANQTDPNTILNETRSELEFESFRSRVEAIHPELDPSDGNEAYDEGIVLQINRLMNGFMAQGSGKQQALDEALSYIYPEGWDKPLQKEPEKPKVAPKKTNIDKNLEAASQQAPEMVDGEDSTAAGGMADLNPMTMTEKQLEALTEEQKSFLRGDNL